MKELMFEMLAAIETAPKGLSTGEILVAIRRKGYGNDVIRQAIGYSKGTGLLKARLGRWIISPEHAGWRGRLAAPAQPFGMTWPDRTGEPDELRGRILAVLATAEAGMTVPSIALRVVNGGEAVDMATIAAELKTVHADGIVQIEAGTDGALPLWSMSALFWEFAGRQAIAAAGA